LFLSFLKIVIPSERSDEGPLRRRKALLAVRLSPSPMQRQLEPVPTLSGSWHLDFVFS
jgi:hypothetical protein